MNKLAAFLTISLIAACGASGPESDSGLQVDTPPVDTAQDSFVRNDYTDMATWLCHPDKADDACSVDLTATVIAADGSTSIEPFTPATDPAFDCFYIYPTISFDPQPNSDMSPGPEELNVISNQFARYGETCRLFAPIYRQRTLAELRNFMATGESTADTDMRYADIADSWNTYLRDHNNGRGVVLIGHSQGAGMIREMLPKEILGQPVQPQIIAVHAIGSTMPIDPETGTVVGLPLCETGDQIGCVVSFASFRATAAPPVQSRFGLASEAGRVACNNPPELAGGTETLDAYMPKRGLLQVQPYEYGSEIDTPYVKLPGLLSSRCERNDTHDWLAITIHADPDDPRIDTIAGDVIVDGEILPDWGLHLIDMNLTMGNLVDLAGQQGDAWLAREAGDTPN